MFLTKIRAFLAARSAPSLKFDPALFDGVWIGETTFEEFKSDGNTTNVQVTIAMFRKVFGPGHQLTINFKFRYADGATREITQAGTWGLEGDELATILSDEYGEQRLDYVLLALDEHTHHYRSKGDKKVYVANRVTPQLEDQWRTFLP